MKKIKYRRLAAMAASLLCCLIFTVPAYAQSSEPQPETAPSPAETEAEPETQNPFTPDGTGTVVDNATDEDGKEFYTITTADESVFYLVIDKQKTSENVYFLNTVTVDELLPALFFLSFALLVVTASLTRVVIVPAGVRYFLHHSFKRAACKIHSHSSVSSSHGGVSSSSGSSAISSSSPSSYSQ